MSTICKQYMHVADYTKECYLLTKTYLSLNLISDFQATRPQLNLGEQVELLHVFHVYVVVVLTGLVREPLETCVVEAECLPLQRHGAGGTEESTHTREDMPYALP